MPLSTIFQLHRGGELHRGGQFYWWRLFKFKTPYKYWYWYDFKDWFSVEVLKYIKMIQRNF